ncbi:MAG: hypothetical protein BROFUL_02892 [Candidatus Brocadia fulgida]|jgi:hypothetical protein|uniref:Phage Mu protein F like protein n=1 Tax=Candidatus Brocadia fulgida TaxID=380242 RepID=A0A0M2UTS3_9BACT|nr:MAG: hypothetical protein BROFUL_02892 [Candidatus Brocadia fulgida]
MALFRNMDQMHYPDTNRIGNRRLVFIYAKEAKGYNQLMTRFIVLFIAAYVVYTIVKKSLKRTPSGNDAQQRTDKKSQPVVTHLKEIAYVCYSAANDDDTCDVCREFDGRHMLPNHKILQRVKPPHAGCKSPKGCRCTLVYVTRDEDGSSEVESLLKKHGGMCDRQTIERN